MNGVRAAVITASLLAAGTPASAAAHGSAPARTAKSCSSGWTHAVINGEHKCLKAGQTCQRPADSQYHRYGFHCHRYDPSVGQYRLTEGGGSSPPPAPAPGPAPEPAKPRAQAIDARITSVVDGDTIRVRAYGAKRRFYTVRLIGIDTPETVRPGVAVQCGGEQATAHMLGLAFSAPRDSNGDGSLDSEGGSGRRVVLRTDPTQDLFDRYDRLLAYVTTVGGISLQTRMLSAGWATTYVYGGEPFQRVRRFRRAEQRARSADRGVHGACDGNFHRRTRGS